MLWSALTLHMQCPDTSWQDQVPIDDKQAEMDEGGKAA